MTTCICFPNKVCLVQHDACFNSISCSNLSKVKCLVGVIYTWTFIIKTWLGSLP
jgi:hypothetical protein